MDPDPLLLSRLQFALTIMFHYLFPPLSIGLGVVMVGVEGMFIKTRKPIYEAMARFWTKIFAVVFAMGVATGIVMEFEFGTNWAAYSRYVGDVFGSALAAEGIFAFFLESGFLAILVFGWDRVSPAMHFFSTIMVALGSIFSSVWIVVANSWMQTPDGFHIVGEGLTARAEIVDFWALVFNPSSVVRIIHVWVGALILGGFFVASIAAYYLLKGRHLDFANRTFTIGMVVASFGALAAPVTGHFQADVVAHYQPAKLAAYEGQYETGPGTLYIFGIPDDEDEEVRYGVGLPGFLSFLIYGDFDAPVTGLDQVPDADEPNVGLVFQTYHAMVALGLLFIGVLLIAWYFRVRGMLLRQRWLLWVFVFLTIPAVAANHLGWVSAEVGRQPWIVYGLLRTSDALSESVSGSEVLVSIILFMVIYLFLFALWLFVMHNKITHGPEDPESSESAGKPRGMMQTAS